MEEPRRFDAEIAGALTPELEGAAHSRAHPRRLSRPASMNENRGELSSATTDSPSAPKQP